jgi:flagellar protein FliO/FliZ
MLGEFLVRLAVALPLVCALAALSLWALRRHGGTLGRLRLPAFSAARQPALPAAFEVLSVRSLSPTTRLAVVRFDGRDHLLGVAGQSVSLLARAEPGAAVPPQGQEPTP